MDLCRFQSLSSREIAALVRTRGPLVCVMPVKGTRRWYVQECAPHGSGQEFYRGYLSAVVPRHVTLFRMLFEHGVTTLFVPSLDKKLLRRGPAYKKVAAEGFSALLTDSGFRHLCRELGVRVSFYGDFETHFSGKRFLPLRELFEDLSSSTRRRTHHQLLFGLFSEDPFGTISDRVVAYCARHHKVPGRRDLTRMYYGKQIPEVNLYLGFGKPRVIPVPFVMNGGEDLYFMVRPSLSLSEAQLRGIMFDHLFARVRSKQGLNPSERRFIFDFYKANEGRTVGVGENLGGQLWYPLPQVVLPMVSRNGVGGPAIPG